MNTNETGENTNTIKPEQTLNSDELAEILADSYNQEAVYERII